MLLLGSSGQVGSELSEQVDRSLFDVLALNRQQLDITDSAALRKLFDDWQPDIVINATAYTAVDRAETEPEQAFAINRDAVGELAALCQARSAALLHISTDYVFDGSKGAPYVEDDPARPLGVYGQSKWEGEQAIGQQLERHIILRTSWVFGRHGNNFVKTMLRLGRERDTLGVVADQRGGPTSAASIARALLTIAARIRSGQPLNWGCYHFSGQPATTWHGLAETAIEQAIASGLIDHPVTVNPLTTEQYPTPVRRPADSRLDCSKIERELGIVAEDWLPEVQGLVASYPP